LGACGLAPVMLVNDKVYGQVTPERALEIIEEIIAKETQA
jgi:NADH-quinone oxidoreductase subunit E